MITRKRVKNFNKIVTCFLCKGYLIEATTINTCVHSFCRSCIVKHIKVFEKHFCPTCETEIRLSNLRPDMRLRSIVYKLIPGLYAKEQHKSTETKAYLNGSTHSSIVKNDKHRLNDAACSEDESLSKQYFYDQDDPISLSLEYHMESIFGNSIAMNNIPQVRYIQAPAAFKVIHLKKFLSSKYDLSNVKKSMNIDIIYEGDVLPDDFSLLDIAYAYSWEREAPLKLFYRIYKSSNRSNDKLKLIEKALNRQAFVRLSTDLKDAMEAAKASKNSQDSAELLKHNNKLKSAEVPRHDLKIIIAKKSSSKGRNIGIGNNKIRLNKPNGNGSNVLSDFERLRGDVDNVQFSSASSLEIVSASEMKTTLSKKSGTVSHHDLKFENKSNAKKHNSNNSDSHAYYETTAMNAREKEKSYLAEKQKKREKHMKNNEKVEKFKSSKSNLSLNIPKLKIDLPSLKTKITVPKTPNDTYVISSASLSSPKSTETPLKKVRFDISTKSSSVHCYDFNDGTDVSFVDQMEYAERIGLKPVERKVESIILHRKRKKSKHSREGEYSKRPKLHVSSSLDESLKLKLKIMGGKSCKNDKKSNGEDAAACVRAIPFKSADSASMSAQEEKQKKQKDAPANDAVVGIENHKYSVTEQKNAKSGSDQAMVFIPKLVLLKAQGATTAFEKEVESSASAMQRRNSFVLEQSSSKTSDEREKIKLKVRSFGGVASSDCANQKLMKPPTAKMGSPKQSSVSTTFSISPIRPHSIPASLKLSPISQSPPSISVKADHQVQNMKRSLSLEAEKSTQSYVNAYIRPSKSPFLTSLSDIQYSKIPPLIATSTSTLRNFYGSMITTSTTTNKSQSPRMPNINVKDPIKLFPNACPSVEILKIPQKTFPQVANVRLNRPLPTTIPLEKIRKSAQQPISQKVLPKSQMIHMKAPSFHQPPQCSSQTLNYSGINQSPINRDISLERYTLELTHDIAKLDRNLSLEKNFEHWEKRKLEEFSKLSELKTFSMLTKDLLNQQQNLSVRNIPNPSAIMMSRNQTSGFNNDSSNSVTVKTSNLLPQMQTVTSTNAENSDIEEILSKSTIAKANEKQLSDLTSQKSPVSKVNDKKSIEKLTEYLRLTAAKSKDKKHDDDNNNNNNNTNKCDESTANGRSFKLMGTETKSDKFMNVSIPSVSVDVICIDS